MKTYPFLCLCVLLSASTVSLAIQPAYVPKWESLDRRPTPAWFLDAKFGVFIHWGVYSVPAWGQVGEYSEWYWNRLTSKNAKWAPSREFHAKNYGSDFNYMDFAPKFTAELFDAHA